MMIHPTEKTIQGVAFNYERTHWQMSDPEVAEDFKVLGEVLISRIQTSPHVKRTLTNVIVE